MLGHDGGEERHELWVGGEVLGGCGERGCGSYGELGRWWCCGEQREEGFGGVEGVFVDELRLRLVSSGAEDGGMG